MDAPTAAVALYIQQAGERAAIATDADGRGDVITAEENYEVVCDLLTRAMNAVPSEKHRQPIRERLLPYIIRLCELLQAHLVAAPDEAGKSVVRRRLREQLERGERVKAALCGQNTQK